MVPLETSVQIRGQIRFLDNTPIDLLVPFQLADTSIQNNQGRVTIRIQAMSTVGRLRPGLTVAAVQADLAAINKEGLAALPMGLGKMFASGQVQAFTLHDHQVGNVRQDLLVLIGAVGFVLLIACANVGEPAIGAEQGARKGSRRAQQRWERAAGGWSGCC